MNSHTPVVGWTHSAVMVLSYGVSVVVVETTMDWLVLDKDGNEVVLSTTALVVLSAGALVVLSTGAMVVEPITN